MCGYEALSLKDILLITISVGAPVLTGAGEAEVAVASVGALDRGGAGAATNRKRGQVAVTISASVLARS